MRQGDSKRGGKNGPEVWSDATWCKRFLRGDSLAGRKRVRLFMVCSQAGQLSKEGVEWEEETSLDWYGGRSCPQTQRKEHSAVRDGQLSRLPG